MQISATYLSKRRKKPGYPRRTFLIRLDWGEAMYNFSEGSTLPQGRTTQFNCWSAAEEVYNGKVLPTAYLELIMFSIAATVAILAGLISSHTQVGAEPYQAISLSL